MVNTLCEACWARHAEWFVNEKVLCTACAYVAVKKVLGIPLKEPIEVFDRKAVRKVLKKISLISKEHTIK